MPNRCVGLTDTFKVLQVYAVSYHRSVQLVRIYATIPEAKWLPFGPLKKKIAEFIELRSSRITFSSGCHGGAWRVTFARVPYPVTRCL